MHEKGKVNGARGKAGEKTSFLNESSPVIHSTRAKPTDDMQLEKELNQAQEPTFKCGLELNPDSKDESKSLLEIVSGQGLMAISFNPKLGWTAEKLGPLSGHWKHLARGLKLDQAQSDTDPIVLKREGLTPVNELDPNVSAKKRRKCTKKTCDETKKIEETRERVGDETVAATQHR